MRYLTAQEVLFIHDYVILETGGSHGIHDLGLLESAVARPQASYDRKDLYPDLFTKAAALLESLARNHAFVDGNKRTAISATDSFLFANGWELDTENGELEEYVVSVVVEHPSTESIAKWIEDHIRQTSR